MLVCIFPNIATLIALIIFEILLAYHQEYLWKKLYPEIDANLQKLSDFVSRCSYIEHLSFYNVDGSTSKDILKILGDVRVNNLTVMNNYLPDVLRCVQINYQFSDQISHNYVHFQG